jgi:metal-responsive CopG/Arc/MetJ family transcriptional regulator
MDKEQKDEMQITISGVPTKLLKRIDALAEKERRNRSNMITLLLEESVERAAGKESKRQLQPA